MFIKIAGLKIHYKIFGQGNPIILLHGWGNSLETFSWLYQLLKNKFTIYAIDLPGFGLSNIPQDIYGIAEYANIIAAFIDTLKIANPILIGHSFGGKIIIKLLTSNSIKAKKIVLISSAGVKLKKPLKITLKIYLYKFIRYLTCIPILKNIFESNLERYKKRFGSNDYKSASNIMRAILVKQINEDVTDLLPKIKAPTLLLWGNDDNSTPLAAGKIMHQLIPESTLKIFHGSGHFPFIDNYEKLTKDLLKFLE